jgi:hypothetical protein
VGDPNAGDDIPAARCDTPCGLDAITVNAGGDPLGCAGIGNGRATSTVVNPAPAAWRCRDEPVAARHCRLRPIVRGPQTRRTCPITPPTPPWQPG